MLKIYVHELKETNSKLEKLIKNNKNIKDYFNKNFIICEILSDYEILLFIKFVEFTPIKKLNDFFKMDLNNLENVNKYNKGEIKFKIDYKDIEFFIGKEEEKVKYMYCHLIGNNNGNNILKEIFSFFNFPLFILNDIDDEILFFDNDKKNFFSNREILHYINYLHLNYGRLFYSIYRNLEIFKKFIKINNFEKITNEDLKIQNSKRDFIATKSKKRYRLNKKNNVLNIHNLIKLKNIDFYEKNDKKYFIYDDSIYNIKEILFLNKENILKIRQNPIRSNEYLFIYEDAILKDKFILKVTKSVSKTLRNNLKKDKEFIKNLIKWKE